MDVDSQQMIVIPASAEPRRGKWNKVDFRKNMMDKHSTASVPPSVKRMLIRVSQVTHTRNTKITQNWYCKQKHRFPFLQETTPPLPITPQKKKNPLLASGSGTLSTKVDNTCHPLISHHSLHPIPPALFGINSKLPGFIDRKSTTVSCLPL